VFATNCEIKERRNHKALCCGLERGDKLWYYNSKRVRNM